MVLPKMANFQPKIETKKTQVSGEIPVFFLQCDGSTALPPKERLLLALAAVATGWFSTSAANFPGVTRTPPTLACPQRKWDDREQVPLASGRQLGIFGNTDLGPRFSSNQARRSRRRPPARRMWTGLCHGYPHFFGSSGSSGEPATVE